MCSIQHLDIKIGHLLHVNLQHAGFHLDGQRVVRVGVDFVENPLACDGDDPLVLPVTHHGIRFSSARLTVRKQ
jgi:hypothetical protein